MKELSSNASDGIKTTRYCVSVVTNFDADDYKNKALEMASGCDYDSAKDSTQAKWQKFFSASKVTLDDKVIESFYNSSLYHLAGCMGNREFPPGLFGNFITDDFFPWAGDYHMNYNYEAPYYCIFSANHPELFDGYMAPINDMKDEFDEDDELISFFDRETIATNFDVLSHQDFDFGQAESNDNHLNIPFTWEQSTYGFYHTDMAYTNRNNHNHRIPYMGEYMFFLHLTQYFFRFCAQLLHQPQQQRRIRFCRLAGQSPSHRFKNTGIIILYNRTGQFVRFIG